MRFFVRMTERSTSDPQELSAMLQHRLNSIAYQQSLLDSELLAYAFRIYEGRVAIELFEVDSLETLDRLIKADPQFPYSMNDVTPLVSTQAMVKEASDYLGESILTEAELAELTFPRKSIEPGSMYWLAYKEVKPFSPLLSQEMQNDVHRRTVVSQRSHHAALEFADDNPVGKSVGILVACGELHEVQAHVRNCEVYPDTEVEFTELMPLKRAWESTVGRLQELQREVPTTSPFDISKVQKSTARR